MKKILGLLLFTGLIASAQQATNLIGSITPSQVKSLAPSATTDTTNAGNITTGTLPYQRLPVPTNTTPGGINSYTAVTHQWIDSIVGAAPHSSQPSFSDLTAGTVAVTETIGSNGSVTPTGTGTVTATNFNKFTSIASLQAAGCVGTSAASSLDLAATSAPTPTCHSPSSANYATYGSLDFSPNQIAWMHVTLPSDWVPQKDGNNATVTLKMYTGIASGSINFKVGGFCYEGTTPTDPTNPSVAAYTTVGSNVTTPASTNNIFKDTIEFNPTNCSAGNELFIIINRTDAVAGTISLLSVNVSLSRTF